MEKELDFQINSDYPPCLSEGCKRDTYGGSRGMCMNHYAMLQAKVKKGKITWEELESIGMARPKLTRAELAHLRSKNVGYERVWSKNFNKYIFVKIPKEKKD